MTDGGPGDGTHAGLRRRNRAAVLREIVLSGPLSRVGIAQRTGLTQASVSRIARLMIDEGLVRELAGRLGGGTGRRQVPLGIEPRGGYVLHLGIGQTLRTVTLADLGNRALEHAGLEIGTMEDPDVVVRDMAREAQRMIGTLPDGRARLLGILVMISARVDRETGAIEDTPYLGWGPYPLQARLSEALDFPVRVQSMAATIARAELLFGAARGRDSVLTLVASLGVGAAVVLEGRVIGGGRLPAGGIGRAETVGEDGAVAALDDVASGTRVLRRLHGEDMRPRRAPVSRLGQALNEAIERDLAGDAAVSRAMSEAGRALGRAVVQFTPLSPPELVLLAGPLARAPSYLEAVRGAVAEGAATRDAEVLAGGVTGAPGGVAPTCALAIYEFLVERPRETAGGR